MIKVVLRKMVVTDVLNSRLLREYVLTEDTQDEKVLNDEITKFITPSLNPGEFQSISKQRGSGTEYTYIARVERGYKDSYRVGDLKHQYLIEIKRVTVEI